MPRTSRLQRLLRKLPPPDSSGAEAERDPWHRILRENVVYLADDEARAKAFGRLLAITNAEPARILRASDAQLATACGPGKWTAQQIAKVRRAAERFASIGDPRHLVTLPRPASKKALRGFPGIADPGVDKLRLFAGSEPCLALDSNALRVLLRLGYGTEAKAYANTYRSVQAEATLELPATCAPRIDAYLRLRAHGKTVCKNTAPRCPSCPLARECPSAVSP